MKKEVTQYTLLVAILAVLIYIVVVSIGNIATTGQNKSSLSEIQDSIPISIYFLIRFHYYHIQSRVKAICNPAYCV